MGHLSYDCPAKNDSKSASGSSLIVFGKADFVFKLGSHSFTQETVVATLQGLQGILGIDFLSRHDGTLSFGDNTLQLGGHKVKLNPQPVSQCAHIRVSETVSIPKNSECYFAGYVDGEIDSKLGIIEPTKLVSNQGLLLAKTLIAPQKGREVTLSVLNLTAKDIKIQSNTFVGSLHSVGQVHEISEENHVDSTQLPPYLQDVLDRTSNKLTPAQKSEVKDLLQEYQDLFAGPDGTLGNTKLVEHTIDTQGALPIKIPPRRISPGQKLVVEKELDSMLEKGVIQRKL
ncbi:uncharacterized protein LOC117321033 [Pecten maximus]|uniref:uncharacterized protein LOC117321033 n=1 Tax=Pecten maximus TaxID=6579 RepID=UPI001457F405|nr:uncharacterized protein LOC117321033 [Pecten maximus]